MTFNCDRAAELISKPCNTEHDAMLRVIEARPMLELVKALIEQAHGASVIKRDALDEALLCISNGLDELPNVDGWEELHEIERL